MVVVTGGAVVGGAVVMEGGVEVVGGAVGGGLQSTFVVEPISDFDPSGQRKHEASDVPPMESLYVVSRHGVHGTIPVNDHWPFGQSAMHLSADLDSSPRVLVPSVQCVH